MSKKSKLAPRNPLVAAGLFRKAGAHDKPSKAKRRQEKMADLRSWPTDGSRGGAGGLGEAAQCDFLCVACDWLPRENRAEAAGVR